MARLFGGFTMKPFVLMVIQNDNTALMYETKDTSIHNAISSIEQMHALQYPTEQFRVVYAEEIIE